jgi:hypothetical protein
MDQSKLTHSNMGDNSIVNDPYKQSFGNNRISLNEIMNQNDAQTGQIQSRKSNRSNQTIQTNVTN